MSELGDRPTARAMFRVAIEGKEGTPSMDSRQAASDMPDPDAVEFVRFCYRRRRVGWPELYDEMCAVAGRGLFRGYTADDLADLGIGFSLFGMPALAVLSARIVAEEQALRRPVAVMITADVARAAVSEPEPIVEFTPPIQESTLEPRDERTFEVPVRLALAPGIHLRLQIGFGLCHSIGKFRHIANIELVQKFEA